MTCRLRQRSRWTPEWPFARHHSHALLECVRQCACQSRVGCRRSAISDWSALCVAAPGWWRALASRKWTATRGQIESSTVASPRAPRLSTVVVPDVHFWYDVEGVRYEGTPVRFNFHAYRAADTIVRYPVGKHVTVYYNPRSPKQSVLEPGLQPGDVRRALYPFFYAVAISGAVYVIDAIQHVNSVSPR